MGKGQVRAEVEEKRTRIMEAIEADPNASVREIARRLGVQESTIRRLLIAVQSGYGMRDKRAVMVPDGRTLSEVCGDGLARELAGESPEAIASDLGVAIRAYRAGRDLLQLKRNPRLTEEDCARVTAAIAEMDATKTPYAPSDRVLDLIHGTWGTARGVPHDDERRERFLEGYMNALSVLSDSSQRLVEMGVPYLGIAERREARAALRRAMSAIRQVARTLSGGVT